MQQLGEGSLQKIASVQQSELVKRLEQPVITSQMVAHLTRTEAVPKTTTSTNHNICETTHTTFTPPKPPQPIYEIKALPAGKSWSYF